MPLLDLKYELDKRKREREQKELITIPTQVRICYTGSFLSELEADRLREEFLAGYQKDIDEGNLVIVEDSISMINSHYVVRLMAENKQLELSFD